MTENNPKSPEVAAKTATARPTRTVLVGTVVSAKGEKSLVVRVNCTTRHPLYKKTLRVSKKYYVHDEANAASAGDQVQIMGCRPQSKLKKWRLVKVLAGTSGGGTP